MGIISPVTLFGTTPTVFSSNRFVFGARTTQAASATSKGITGGITSLAGMSGLNALRAWGSNPLLGPANDVFQAQQNLLMSNALDNNLSADLMNMNPQHPIILLKTNRDGTIDQTGLTTGLQNAAPLPPPLLAYGSVGLDGLTGWNHLGNNSNWMMTGMINLLIELLTAINTSTGTTETGSNILTTLINGLKGLLNGNGGMA